MHEKHRPTLGWTLCVALSTDRLHRSTCGLKNSDTTPDPAESEYLGGL